MIGAIKPLTAVLLPFFCLLSARYAINTNAANGMLLFTFSLAVSNAFMVVLASAGPGPLRRGLPFMVLLLGGFVTWLVWLHGAIIVGLVCIVVSTMIYTSLFGILFASAMFPDSTYQGVTGVLSAGLVILVFTQEVAIPIGWRGFAIVCISFHLPILGAILFGHLVHMVALGRVAYWLCRLQLPAFFFLLSYLLAMDHAWEVVAVAVAIGMVLYWYAVVLAFFQLTRYLVKGVPALCSVIVPPHLFYGGLGFAVHLVLDALLVDEPTVSEYVLHLSYVTLWFAVWLVSEYAIMAHASVVVASALIAKAVFMVLEEKRKFMGNDAVTCAFLHFTGHSGCEINSFLKQCTSRSQGSKITPDELYAAYESWWRAGDNPSLWIVQPVQDPLSRDGFEGVLKTIGWEISDGVFVDRLLLAVCEK